jgi:hypothetical protein
MSPPKPTSPEYESLRSKVDALLKEDKMILVQDLISQAVEEDRKKLLQDLSVEINLSEEDWQELAPFLLPEALRKKLLRYPWSLKDRRNLGLLIKVPICLQDPSFIRDESKLGFEMIEVGWEPGLSDGPTSARISVEDQYKTKSGTHKPEPAKWDEDQRCFVDQKGQPIAPRLNKDQFHQINVWAIAQRILEFYEDYTVLGRPAPWGFNGNRLIIKPHARTEVTGTYYDPVTKSLEFAYIQDTVFTCLSHDIVAHETGHAVLDGIRPYFFDSWTLETKAFHECIADLTAIMSALRNNYVRNIFTEFLEKGLPEKDFLAKIGEEFGKATSTYDFIRSAVNKVTMDQVRQWEKDRSQNASHNSSQVLTGLIYDLLNKLFQGYKQRGHTPDNAAWHATRRLTQMALQPIDFLPPVDVTFSDYVEAFLIRDELLDPEDEHEYRPLFRQLCDDRKIQAPPEGQRPKRPYNLSNPPVDSLLASRTSAYKYIHANRAALLIPAMRDVIVDVYAAQKVDRTFFRLPQEIIVQYIWKEDFEYPWKEHVEFKELENEKIPLLCGGTLVFDQNANFQYWVNKPGTEFKLKKESAEQKKGELRKQELLNYVDACVDKQDKGAIKRLLRGRFVTRK